MAYNNGFPMNYQYQPIYPQYQYSNTPNTYSNTSNTLNNTQSAVNTGIIWVQGEAGAKSYLVAPNNTVQLWDSESQTIYLKSADASGMPSMRILDYTIRNNENHSPQVVQQPQVDYVTREEFSTFVEQVKAQLEKPKKEVKKNEQ